MIKRGVVMFVRTKWKVILPVCVLIILIILSSTSRLKANNINHKKYTIDELTEAILSNEESKVKEIIDSGEVDINTKDTEDIYPLEKSLVFSNYEMAKLLLDSGANPDIETSSGETIREIVNKDDSKMMKDLFDKY
jgi:ankyrin repeat protein